MRKLPGGIVGGEPCFFICSVHRIAAALIAWIHPAAGPFSHSPADSCVMAERRKGYQIPRMKDRSPLFRIFTLSILSIAPVAMHATRGYAATTSGCAPIEPLSAPQTAISNGIISAIVLLPDAKKGYYRGSRFDWSGIVGCLTFRGHSYFGAWFPKYDPTHHDSITGPVEEFRSADGNSALGYDQAKPGGIFIKPGVGVLRRIDEKPFDFTAPYPLVDGGKWTVHAEKRQVVFRQDLNSQMGISYVYQKKLKLIASQPVLMIEHKLKNTGSEPIDTQVYNHDFFMLDAAPTGPGMVVRFPFVPATDRPLEDGAYIEGKQILYARELKKGESAFAAITGYGDRSSDFDFVVEDTNSGVGVEELGSLPLSRVFFWSIRTTICPEAYVHIQIKPGQTARWTIRYRFVAK